MPFNESDPLDPSNRRISIVVLNIAPQPEGDAPATAEPPPAQAAYEAEPP